MSLKRTAACENTLAEEMTSDSKKPRYQFYYVLEEESEQPTDEDSESVHSIQEKETDVAKDTSDTSSESSNDATMEVEYDVASLSEKENPLGDATLSSDTDDIIYASSLVVLCEEEPALFADSSEISDSSVIIDPEVPRADYWTCVQCKNKNNNPLFRYCEKCYKLRKNFFPPRPRRRARTSKNVDKPSSLVKSVSLASTISLSNKIDIPTSNLLNKDSSCNSLESNFSFSSQTLDSIAGPSHLDSGLGSMQELSHSDSQEVMGNSNNSNMDLCITCMTSPKNGIFVHRKIGHICCCYKCALRVWTEGRRCPLCNCKVNNVIKAIVQ